MYLTNVNMPVIQVYNVDSVTRVYYDYNRIKVCVFKLQASKWDLLQLLRFENFSLLSFLSCTYICPEHQFNYVLKRHCIYVSQTILDQSHTKFCNRKRTSAKFTNHFTTLPSNLKNRPKRQNV